MNCCGDHNHSKQNERDNQHGGMNKSRNWFMILCCVLPMILAGVLIATKTVGGSAGNWIPLLLIFICPLSHLVVMARMNRKNKGGYQ